MGNIIKDINLFEDVDNNYPDVRVYCHNRDESVEFEEAMHRAGFTYNSGNRYLIRDNGQITEVTFYDFDILDKTFSGRKIREVGMNVVDYTTASKFGLINMVTNKAPSYKPRKFDKTFESFSFNESPYDAIAFRVNSMEDVKKIVDVFYDVHKVENRTLKSTIMSELDDYFDNNFRELLIISKRQDKYDGVHLEDLMIDYSKADPKIYSVSDIGKFGGAPSYAPRKMSRDI